MYLINIHFTVHGVVMETDQRRFKKTTQQLTEGQIDSVDINTNVRQSNTVVYILNTFKLA